MIIKINKRVIILVIIRVRKIFVNLNTIFFILLIITIVIQY